MADDEDAQSPAGEFPPGLEDLSAEIERLASSRHQGEDIREKVERIAGQAVPLLKEARGALAKAHGDTDALGGQIREALAAVKSQAAAVLSGPGSLVTGGVILPAATLTGEGTLTAGAGVRAHAGVAEAIALAFDVQAAGEVESLGANSLEVQKSRSVLDRLPPAYVFYIVLIWLLVTGVGVVIDRFNLPPKVVEELQTEPNFVGLALELTLLFLAPRRRR